MSGSEAVEFTELHPAVDYLPMRAIAILERAIKNIKERAPSYNSTEVHYEDYRLNSLESTWEDILECFARLWVSGNEDKAEDWVAYSALQAAFIESGIPQSKFSPAFVHHLSGFYANLKEIDRLSVQAG